MIGLDLFAIAKLVAIWIINTRLPLRSNLNLGFCVLLVFTVNLLHLELFFFTMYYLKSFIRE